jgi:solute carrier family 45, member 1/2/4
VQFWSWIGWFPFLFYGSTWVGEIYLRHEASGAKKDVLKDVGSHGSQAFIIFSVCNFASAIFLPWFIRSPDDDEKPAYTPRPPQSLEPAVKTLEKRKPSLRMAWKCANLLFAASMVFAPFVKTVRSATIIIAFCGIPWTIAGLAPGTFLGVEVTRMSQGIPPSQRRHSKEDIELNPQSSAPLHNSRGSNQLGDAADAELSGIYFGILNIYTTLPQFVGTGISWIVFSMLEPGKSTELAGGKKVCTPFELFQQVQSLVY